MLRRVVIVAILNVVYVTQNNEIHDPYRWNADRDRTYYWLASARCCVYPILTLPHSSLFHFHSYYLEIQVTLTYANLRQP
jgi:hypothetical protein